MTNLLKAINSLSRFNELKVLSKQNVLPYLSVMTNKPKMFSSDRQSQSQSSQTANSLPKLPVPSFNQTMERLRVSAKPFATNAKELEDLNIIIDEFSRSNGTGFKLHSLLEEKSSKTSNWLSHDWWINKAYLEGRTSVMIWSNPGLVFPALETPKTPNKDFVVQYISRMILSLIDFRESLRSGINPEMSSRDQMMKDSLICMDQYNRVFGTCRMPGNPIDSIRFGSLNRDDFSIIISRLNRFYKLNLSQTSKEDMLPIIQTAIVYILTQKPSESIPFGSFTALDRNDFSTVFRLLDENAVNSIIDSEFVVNIDHIQDVDNLEDNESYYKLMGRQSLHSDIDNIGNRWFDKTIQLIIVTNKSGDRVIGSAINYEHTPAEGGTIVKAMEHSVKHLISDKTKSAVVTKPVEVDIEELSLVSVQNLDKVKASADFSTEKYLDFINSIDLEILEFNDYGKEVIKSMRFSPDSWIQLAIGYTFYKLHGKVGATYESAGTRKFAFGRTETIRSVTNQFVEFYKNSNFETLNNAVESHQIVAKNAVNGQAIDRLLLGYYCSAQEVKNNGWKWGLSETVLNNPLTETDYKLLEKLFSNELFKRSKHFHMSTSQVSSQMSKSFMCYGPAVYDGYGCCYNPSKERIIFAISAFNQNNGNTCALSYKTELKKSLQFLREIVLKKSKL